MCEHQIIVDFCSEMVQSLQLKLQNLQNQITFYPQTSFSSFKKLFVAQIRVKHTMNESDVLQKHNKHSWERHLASAEPFVFRCFITNQINDILT